MLSSDFHCKENDSFRVVPARPELVTSDYSVHEVGVTVCGVHHVLWVLGVWVWPEPGHFPDNKNPTRALNTTSLKCRLPSNDAIERREKIHACVWRFMVAHECALYWNPSVFRKKISSDSFLKTGRLYNGAVSYINRSLLPVNWQSSMSYKLLQRSICCLSWSSGKHHSKQNYCQSVVSIAWNFHRIALFVVHLAYRIVLSLKCWIIQRQY